MPPAAGKKTKIRAELRGTGEDVEAKRGDPTSEAAQKTTQRRDSGESLSS